MSKIVPISDLDYQGFYGAEGWGEHFGDEIEEYIRPWWSDLDVRLKGTLDEYDGEPEIDLANHEFEAVIVGDRNGVGLYLNDYRDENEYPLDMAFYLDRDHEPDEAYGAVKALIKNLKRGKIPKKYKRVQ
tara:strand:- start:263 stop:652 length:390 start_codon:yes stop_codon:yes gene_type:complete